MKDKFPDGGWVQLNEQPDGYTTSEYKVSIGQVFRICTRMGCCLEVESSDGETFIINAGRFQPTERPNSWSNEPVPAHS